MTESGQLPVNIMRTAAMPIGKVWEKRSKQIAVMRSAVVLCVLQAPNDGEMLRLSFPRRHWRKDFKLSLVKGINIYNYE